MEDSLNELFSTLTLADIKPEGLFVNADAGFDSKEFREICFKHGIFPNVDFNVRNGEVNDDEFLDELLYKERYSIERTNAWLDSFRTLLNRFDTTISSWKAFNYIAFMVILLKKICKTKKSR
jgi:transposase